MAIFADTAELRATGSIERLFDGSDAGTLEASMDALHLRLFPFDWLTLDLGLQRHTPGAAILLSPVNYLMPVVPDPGTGGDLPSTAGSAALAGGTVFIGGGYLSAHISPAPAMMELSEIDIDALADVALLSEIDDADAGGLLTRSSFTIGATEGLADHWRRASVDIEVGVAIGPFDLTAIYYHGVDRIPTVTGVVDTTSTAAGEFALTVAASESIIDAFGITAQTAVGPAMLWLDGSYVLARTFGTLDVVETTSPNIYQLDTLVAPHLELVAGGTIRMARPSLLVAGEYRHGFVGSQRTDIIRLDFPGTALLSLTADMADGLVAATAAGIVVIPDRSAVLVGSVEVAPSSELSAYIQAPVVFAGNDSLLREFRSILAVTAGVVYRF